MDTRGHDDVGTRRWRWCAIIPRVARSSYTPPDDAAQVFARYKALTEEQKRLRPTVDQLADREMRAGASIYDLDRLTGVSREIWRRLARQWGIDLKRDPVRGRRSAETAKPSEETGPNKDGLPPEA